MTPEAQRIAIAESRGWKQCQWNGAYGTLLGVPPVRPSLFQNIPDYLNNRDAMYEVLGTLSAGQFHIFRKHLRWLVVKGYIHHDGRNVQNPVVHQDMFLAPLPLIARAYLMTKRLWVEEDNT